jgi:hypothetical protein
MCVQERQIGSGRQQGGGRRSSRGHVGHRLGRLDAEHEQHQYRGRPVDDGDHVRRTIRRECLQRRAQSSGELFGSDHFFIGGEGDWLVAKALDPPTDTTPARGTDDPELFKNFRRGAFSYFVPLDDGDYTVALGFLEPDKDKQIGERVFDVVANGETKLKNLDVLKAAKGEYRTVVTESFTTQVTNGYLKLDFTPSLGEAVVSNIRIRKQ